MEEGGWQLPPLVPRPDFLSRRPLIPDFLLKDKREGRFITAVPAIGWDQQAGFTLGVVGFLFDNGTKDDPFFRTTPYREEISVTALGALSGLRRCNVLKLGVSLDTLDFGPTHTPACWHRPWLSSLQGRWGPASTISG